MWIEKQLQIFKLWQREWSVFKIQIAVMTIFKDKDKGISAVAWGDIWFGV